MNNDILILRHDKNEYFFPYLMDDYHIDSYRKQYDRKRIRLCIVLSFFNVFIFNKFCNWSKYIKQYKTIVLFDSWCDMDVIKFIRTRNRKAKIIVVYHNIISNTLQKRLLRMKEVDCFVTFDKADAQRYGIKYCGQFYTKKIIADYYCKKKYDLLFLGKCKDRENELKQLKEYCRKIGIKTRFIIVKNQDEFIDYLDYIEMVKKSKAIVELVQNGQTGLTLRTMEALFFNKKLVTNNYSIRNEPGYSSEYVFIWDQGNTGNLKEFINRVSDYDNHFFVNYYDFESWINRIIKMEEDSVNEN